MLCTKCVLVHTALYYMLPTNSIYTTKNAVYLEETLYRFHEYLPNCNVKIIECETRATLAT